VAVGLEAGATNQSSTCVAVGRRAGYSGQSPNATAVGNQAGFNNMGQNAVAVGYNAGNNNFADRAVALGAFAGQNVTGSNAICIGYNAGGGVSVGANTIVIDALGTGSVGGGSQASSLFVNPIRSATQTNVLGYDTTTKEVSYFDETSLFGVGTPTSYNPILSDAGGNLNSANYSIRVSEYVKMGKMVFYQGNIIISGKGGLTGANNIRLSIPFTSDNTADFFQTFPIGRMNNMTTNIVSVSATIAPNTDFMSFFIRTAASADADAMTVSDISTTWNCRFGGFYIANA
jgi:hypothetical protein